MEEDPQSALGHVNRGIDAHADGDSERARRHFAQALHLEPGNEVAWLWMSESSTVAGEQLYCLNRAVDINPDTRGKPHRDALRQARVSATIPPAIRDLEDPPIPPSYRPGAPALVLPISLRGRSRRWIKPAPDEQPSDDAADAPKPVKPVVREDWHWLWLVALSAVMTLAAAGTYWWFSHDTFVGQTWEIALVAPMTGNDAWVGEELERGADVAVGVWNETNDDFHLKLRVLDDRNDPATAVNIANDLVADPNIVAVIGHGTSTTSLAAAPIYQAAGLPVISSTATVNDLSNFEVYFRTVFSDESEATMLATYLRQVLAADRVTIVAGDTTYEENLSGQFANAFGEDGGVVAGEFVISAEDPATSIASIVSALQDADDPGTIFLATTESHGHEFLLALRRAGLTTPVFASEAMGSSEFAERFTNEPEEADDPGFFTEGIYAVSPLIYDSVGANAIRFSEWYEGEYGVAPSWRPARTWDAVSAIAAAIRRGELSTGNTEANRAIVRTELAAMTDSSTAVPGITGDFYFTDSGDSPQSMSIGQFTDGVFSSAPTQYRLVANPGSYDMDDEIEAGRAIDMGGYYLRQYRVVYVGVEMIELRDLKTAEQTFFADFFIYFRWNGDEAPLDVIFTNSTSASLELKDPISVQVTKAGQNYHLYRVQGTFSEPLDFHDYPWDQHSLTIRMVNPVLSQNDLVYVPDPAAMGMSQADRQRSSMDQGRSFNRLPSWSTQEVLFTQVSITSTADNYDTDGLVQYSEFQVIVDIGRDVRSFLVKNLLPLALLALVTYIAIWFPPEQAGARVSFAITALLSSSVMLINVSNQLPEIGYTVAIEWGYYAYLWMSAILILLTIAVDRSYKAKRFARVRKLDAFIRTAYPLSILVVVGTYWWQFYR